MTAAGLRSLLAVLLVGGTAVSAATLVEGFQESVVFQGLERPTAIAFASDGRVFVAEKDAVLKVFDGLGDADADVVIDLDDPSQDFWDRGMLGLAVDPDFPTQPYVYVFYTLNTDPLEPDPSLPLWGDFCPMPPGATDDGCVVNARLSRLEVDADNALVGSEVVLLENRWCQQFPSHSVGDVVFGENARVLYVSSGEGANFNVVDYGQFGGTESSPTPPNPCDDPPGGRGGVQVPPDAEGGALRSQDLRSSGDPVTFDGTVIAVDPDTGQAAPTNPLLGGDPEDDPIIAYGLRNPFRMAVRPGTAEVGVGDVGWSDWEEINRVADAGDALVENFGWPCFEGPGRQPAYDSQDLALCEDLYIDAADPARPPYFTYERDAVIDPDPDPFGCNIQGTASVTGLAFYDGAAYPATYDGALFFADYSRDCIYSMLPDGQGLPDPSTLDTFADGIANPVQLVVGPDGSLYYPDFDGGRVMRIDFVGVNAPPVAVAVADVTSGLLPLDVQFDASQSTDPDAGDTLSYAWDLDGDGFHDDSDQIAPVYQYTVQGQYRRTRCS
jgi:glucose/arabinose dehydrogenase